MSSPIDLTASDDDIVSSRPRSKGKRKVTIDLDGVDGTPTKRSHHTPGSSSLPSSSRGGRRHLSRFSDDHTPTKSAQHSAIRRDSGVSLSPLGFNGVEHTPTKSAKHLNNQRDSHSISEHTPQIDESGRKNSQRNRQSESRSSTLAADDSEDEVDEAFEFEETTRIEFERATHHREAKEVPEGHKIVSSAQINECLLEPGMSVELQDHAFLRIAYIFRNKSKNQSDSGAYLLRGILLRRNKNMDDTFPRIVNELVAMISIPMDDKRPHFVAGLLDRPLDEVVCIRKIRFSNARFPEFSFREDEDTTRWYHYDVEQNKWMTNNELVAEEAHLVCRFKSVERWRPNLKPYSDACLRLQPDEADQAYRRTNVYLIHQYLREIRGRADGGPSENTAIQGGMADLYCGSGGASEGARLAGLSIAVAVDNKACAVRSHQHNHPHCLTIHDDVSNFITAHGEKGHFICDLCHSSCPCRFWSPLHTVAGKNDEANEAASFMVEAAAKKLGCRIMSFEQTPGFSRIKKHRPQWNAFIHQFTSMGFSVEWKLISFAETGGPNKRPRLWIFATCPGQKMPEDVQATHGPPGSGLRPYVTVREAISNIPATATMHDPQVLVEKFRRAGGKSALPTAEWDKPLQHLIPTCGPRALHPSGTRPFTVRETLCLQGFGTRYHYIGGENGEPPTRTESMAMAGDAIPPKSAVAYFASAKEALRVTDEEMAACRDEVIE